MTSPNWTGLDRNQDLDHHVLIYDRIDDRCVAEMHTYEPDDLFAIEVGGTLPNEIFAKRNEIRIYRVMAKTTEQKLVDDRVITTTVVEVEAGPPVEKSKPGTLMDDVQRPRIDAPKVDLLQPGPAGSRW